MFQTKTAELTGFGEDMDLTRISPATAEATFNATLWNEKKKVSTCHSLNGSFKKKGPLIVIYSAQYEILTSITGLMMVPVLTCKDWIK